MRYGNQVLSKILKLHKAGCERLIILPLYPQYAAATTATVVMKFIGLMGMRWQPSLQIIPHYESEPMYIKALVNTLETKISKLSWRPDLIIASYHGIPQKYFDKGSLPLLLSETTRLMTEQFRNIEIRTTFQSDLVLRHG